MKERTILHVDYNYFYAQCELFYRVKSRGRPFAVGGREEARYGIILAKDPRAKARGVRTGSALWEAREKCPGIEIVPPNYPLYVYKSDLGMKIFRSYSDLIQSYGLDEAYVDITDCLTLHKSPETVVDTIMRRTIREAGLTVSVGKSFCKVFAKLASDMAGRNECVEITRDNFKQVAWERPASELLYVGPATTRKLASRGIYTIGDLANADVNHIRSFLHKPGELLWAHANGYDHSAVDPFAEGANIKSIGNSQTLHRDLTDEWDVYLVFCMLAESVAARLRAGGFEATTIHIGVRDFTLGSYSRQAKLTQPTNIAAELVEGAMALFLRHHRWPAAIRSLEIRGADLIPAGSPSQMSIFVDETHREKLRRLERVKDNLRESYGYHALQYCAALTDRALTGTDIRSENTIFPVSYVWG